MTTYLTRDTVFSEGPNRLKFLRQLMTAEPWQHEVNRAVCVACGKASAVPLCCALDFAGREDAACGCCDVCFDCVAARVKQAVLPQLPACEDVCMLRVECFSCQSPLPLALILLLSEEAVEKGVQLRTREFFRLVSTRGSDKDILRRVTRKDKEQCHNNPGKCDGPVFHVSGLDHYVCGSCEPAWKYPANCQTCPTCLEVKDIPLIRPFDYGPTTGCKHEVSDIASTLQPPAMCSASV